LALGTSTTNAFAINPGDKLTVSGNNSVVSFFHALPRILAFVLCFTALGGCSMLRVGYKQLDTYAVWTADDYFGLDQSQRRDFLSRFDRLHEWHRYEQLPEYTTFLAAIRVRVQKGFTREDYLWVADGAKKRYRVVVDHAANDTAAMLMTITPAQIEVLQRQWDKVNRRYVSEYRLDRGAEEQRQARDRRLFSRIREWTGNLSPEQEKKIIALADTSEVAIVFYRLRHEDRLRRQHEFLQLMTQRGDAARFQARLRHFLINWEEGRNPEYDKLFREWERKQGDVYAELAHMLTPEQLATALRRLQGYMDVFTDLSKRPAATGR